MARTSAPAKAQPSGRDARRRMDIDRNVSGDAASRPYIASICLHAVTKLIFSLALGR
jgi:hypothetical protein